MKSSEIRNANQYTRDVVGNQVIERICGLRIVVANSVYNANGTLTPILNGTVVVMSSGLAAQTRESKPLQADRDYTKSNAVLTIFGERSFKTIVTQPKLIALINNVYSA